ncbi:hypothetical protein Hanom_Chr04g00311771 [Helianthus anomalus]
MSSVPTNIENTVTEIPKSGYRYRIYLVRYGTFRYRSALVRHRYLMVKTGEYRSRNGTENTPGLINLVQIPIPDTI